MHCWTTRRSFQLQRNFTSNYWFFSYEEIQFSALTGSGHPWTALLGSGNCFEETFQFQLSLPLVSGVLGYTTVVWFYFCMFPWPGLAMCVVSRAALAGMRPWLVREATPWDCNAFEEKCIKKKVSGCLELAGAFPEPSRRLSRTRWLNDGLFTVLAPVFTFFQWTRKRDARLWNGCNASCWPFSEFLSLSFIVPCPTSSMTVLDRFIRNTVVVAV
jgi:hypothetical protein